MTRTLILHIGTTKTGTTAVQNFLKTHHRALRRFGAYYPVDLHHHNETFQAIFVENHPSLSFMEPEAICNHRKNLRTRWINEFKSANKPYFIISSEVLIYMNDSQVHELSDFVSSYFDEIKIIAYFRSPEQFILSHVQQEIKNGFSRRSIEEVIALSANQAAAYHDNLRIWQNQFPSAELIVRPFVKDAFINDNLIDDFFLSAGIENFSSNNLKIVRMNESLDTNSILFLERLNQTYPVIKGKTENTDRGMAAFKPAYCETAFLHVSEGKFSFPLNLDEDTIDRINKSLNKVNEYFPEEHQLEKVEYHGERFPVPSFSDIPDAFFIDLVNQLHKRIAGLELVHSTGGDSGIRRHIKNPGMFAIKNVLSEYRASGDRPLVVIKNAAVYIFYKIFGLNGFDAEYYLENYPYVTDRIKDPLMHYIFRGNYMAFNPNKDFNTKNHVISNPGLLRRGKNALIHFKRSNKL